MTVEELIQALKHENPKAQVGFAYPVGDYWNTLAVGGVVEVAETTVVVEESGYGHEGHLPRGNPDEYDETISMVVLSRCYAALVQWGPSEDQRWICQHVHNTAKGAIDCGTWFDKAREEKPK